MWNLQTASFGDREIAAALGLLAPMISRFRRERILRDYLEDDKLLVRLNQVMRRLELAPLPERLRELLPQSRRLVEDRRSELLEGIPTPEP